jgi:hypothetical protein
MLINPKTIGYWRIMGGYRDGKDYLIVVRFDTPMNDKAYQEFHAWALNFFEGLYSALPSQGISGVFIGKTDELKKEIVKELK